MDNFIINKDGDFKNSNVASVPLGINNIKISNKDSQEENKENLYVIKNSGVNNEDIYVTGSHLIFDENIQEFIKVENYNEAIKTDISTDYFSCLITNDHKITIGSQIFWDWEDHYIKLTALKKNISDQ